MALFSSREVRVESHVVPVVQTVVHEGMSADRATQVLLDFQEKAKSNIVKTLISQLGDNSLAGAVVVFKDIAALSYKAIISFTINGHEYVVEKSIADGKMLSKQQAAEMLVKEVSEAIAVKLIVDKASNIKEIF